MISLQMEPNEAALKLIQEDLLANAQQLKPLGSHSEIIHSEEVQGLVNDHRSALDKIFRFYSHRETVQSANIPWMEVLHEDTTINFNELWSFVGDFGLRDEVVNRTHLNRLFHAANTVGADHDDSIHELNFDEFVDVLVRIAIDWAPPRLLWADESGAVTEAPPPWASETEVTAQVAKEKLASIFDIMNNSSGPQTLQRETGGTVRVSLKMHRPVHDMEELDEDITVLPSVLPSYLNPSVRSLSTRVMSEKTEIQPRPGSPPYRVRIDRQLEADDRASNLDGLRKQVGIFLAES